MKNLVIIISIFQRVYVGSWYKYNHALFWTFTYSPHLGACISYNDDNVTYIGYYEKSRYDHFLSFKEYMLVLGINTTMLRYGPLPIPHT